jgi:hypothetical protein
MDAFIEELRRAVHETAQKQEVERRQSAAYLRMDADVLSGKWSEILERQKAIMQDAMVAALGESIEVVDQQRAGLMRIESTLPESLAATFTSLIQETQQASGSLADPP